jgi:hypothetical protein
VSSYVQYEIQEPRGERGRVIKKIKRYWTRAAVEVGDGIHCWNPLHKKQKCSNGDGGDVYGSAKVLTLSIVARTFTSMTQSS